MPKEFELPEHLEQMIRSMIHPRASYEEAVALINRALFMKNRVEPTGMLSVEAIAVLLASNGFDTLGDVQKESQEPEEEESREDERVVSRAG